jgi:hypothetical protein
LWRLRHNTALAHILVHKFVEAEKANIRAGLPPTDAREEAEKDWLMMEPEEDGGREVQGGRN